MKKYLKLLSKAVKEHGKSAALLMAGVLTGILVSAPAAQAAAQLLATPSSQTFYLDGQRIELTAYEIGGNNYIKLRDVGRAVDFGVDYDAAANAVHISPDKPYVEEVNAAPVESGKGDGCLANGKPITEENVLELLRQIEQDWPQDTIWGKRDTPGTYKNEVPSTEARRIVENYPVNSIYGCGGYAAMVSSLVFGDTENPGRKLDDLSQIRPSDIVFLVNNATDEIWHVEIALESPNETHAFQYTDGNHGGHIHWPDPSNPYGGENLDCFQGEKASYHIDVWTRYPENVPYSGTSVNVWYQ